jgi:hypothetical protein
MIFDYSNYSHYPIQKWCRLSYIILVYLNEKKKKKKKKKERSNSSYRWRTVVIILLHMFYVIFIHSNLGQNILREFNLGKKM